MVRADFLRYCQEFNGLVEARERGFSGGGTQKRDNSKLRMDKELKIRTEYKMSGNIKKD
jgi:hypothetical protein